MPYKSFDNQKLKLPAMWERADAQRDLIKKLRKTQINFNKLHSNKTIQKIVIFEPNNPIQEADYNYPNEGEFLLTNFPDWAINSIRPLVYFTAESDAIDLFTPTFSDGYFKYMFYKIDSNQYIFQYSVSASLLDEEDNDVIVFPHIYLILYNNRNFESLIKSKNG